MVARLSFEDCRALYRELRPLDTKAARQRVTDFLERASV
jgi:hypothetical protein